MRMRFLMLVLLTISGLQAQMRFRQLSFDSTAVLEIEVPADSDLTLGSRTSINGKVWQEVALAARTQPRDSVRRVRLILAATDTVRLCGSLEPLAGCRLPSKVVGKPWIFLQCINESGFGMDPHPTTNLRAGLSQASALKMIQETMGPDSGWSVYRYGELDTGKLAVGTGSWRAVGIDSLYWSSPWNAGDWLRVKGQWRRPDSAYPRGGKDSLILKSWEPYAWRFAGKDSADAGRSLLKLGLAREVASRFDCIGTDTFFTGTRRLVTLKGNFLVEGNFVIVDSLVSTRGSNFGSNSVYNYLRGYLPLAKLDSLLRHPPVGVASMRREIVASLRIGQAEAILDAGGTSGRLELVDARGQILSKVSGRGQLRLPLVGQGVRWVRWRSGAEQGSVPVVF